MSTISYKNIRQLCRACLRTLKHDKLDVSKSVNKSDGGVDETSNLNNLLIPKLCKLFKLLTNYDINKESEDFPKHLCELCFVRLKDYGDFREIIIKSTEILHKHWNVKQAEKNTPYEQNNDSTTLLFEQIKCEGNDDVNDDDQLLLPELANVPLNIKVEPISETVDSHLTVPYILEEGEINRAQTSYATYESEDADDEELLLPNGAANNSSPSINISDVKANKRILSKRYHKKKSLFCNTCNKQFYKQVYLDAHIRGTHLGQEKPFQCSNCTKSFTRYKQLILHTKSQHIEMLFRCDYQNCDASFSVAVKLKTHRQVVHNSLVTPISSDCRELQENKIKRDNICQLCWRKYSSKRALREHIKRHNQIKEHVCLECGVAKVTRTELKTHMRTHGPNLEKFTCPQCPQVFNHKNAISRHVKVVHEGLRRFPCTFCSKRFGTRNSQICHERLHTGERPYICEICQKGFVQQEGLRSHMKNHDKSLRKHVCKYCSQRFITVKNLIDHERRHMSDKPHICNICSKGFCEDEELCKHRTKHFQATDGNGTVEKEKEIFQRKSKRISKN